MNNTMAHLRLYSVAALQTLVFAALVVCYGTMASCGGKSGRDDFEQIRQSGEIRFVSNIAPLSYFVANGDTAGFNYELLSAMQKYTPLRFRILLDNSFESSLSMLSDGECDVIMQNVALNADLKRQYLFVSPIVFDRLMLVQRTSAFNSGKSPIRSHLELGGSTIYIASGSPAIFRLRNLEEEIGDSFTVVEDPLYGAHQLAMMVAGKEIDYTVCDQKTAEALAAEMPELDIKTAIGFTQLESWIVRKNSGALCDSLNQWLARLKDEGVFDKLYRKYYGKS